MRKHLKASLFIGLLLIIFSSAISQETINGEALLKRANLAKGKLLERQNKKGAWNTYVNFDTIAGNFRKDNNFFAGMLIADLLQPYRNESRIDSAISKALMLSFININPDNGFLKYYTRYDDLPEDTDDTGLFWYLARSVDSGFVFRVIDSLQKYRARSGLYLEWLKKGGIKHMPQTGANPETIEIIPNIHVYLFLSKYDSLLAGKLCRCLQAEDVVSNPDFWVYYYRAPWLYYIRQADMFNNKCMMKDNLPQEVKSPESQKYFVKASKLIRDIALGNTNAKIRNEGREVLDALSLDGFEYIENNPMLIYHSDLTSRAPAHFWSYDVPYALWLRLYYEYTNAFSSFDVQ